MPNVQREIDQMHALAASDPSGGDLVLTEQLQTDWQRFLTFTQSPNFLTAASGPSKTDDAVSARLEGLAKSLKATVGEIDAAEVKQANNARDEAEATCARSLFLLWVFVAVGFVAGATAALWLTRDVVRRVRAYSTFAARVAAGDLETRADPTGHDELTALGETLNDGVAEGVGSGLSGHPGRVHRRPADDGDRGGGARTPQASPGALDRIKDSVTQAAPVLANLRNLAIAELRAATDALTGLPNTRAVQDVMNRLVAQASRMVWPLTAVLFDLDHFKQINDTFGHPRGTRCWQRSARRCCRSCVRAISSAGTGARSS